MQYELFTCLDDATISQALPPENSWYVLGTMENDWHVLRTVDPLLDTVEEQYAR